MNQESQQSWIICCSMNSKDREPKLPSPLGPSQSRKALRPSRKAHLRACRRDRGCLIRIASLLVVVGKGLLPGFGPDEPQVRPDRRRGQLRKLHGSVAAAWHEFCLRPNFAAISRAWAARRRKFWARRGHAEVENLGGVFAARLCEGCEGGLALSSQGNPLILLGL